MFIQMNFARTAVCVALLFSAGPGNSAEIAYRSVNVDGMRVFFREAGDPKSPTVLLLHGVPTSSRMYDGLMRRLGDRYHLVAPDYPGFGQSDAPVRMRLAIARPDAVVGMVFQNANISAEGLGPV